MRASPQQGAEDREHREQQQRARRQVLAKHRFHHGPADQYCDQGPVPRPPVRGIRGSRFGPQRAECVGGHLISLGSPRDRRIRRKYKSTAVPTARSRSGSGADVPAAGIREGGSTHPTKTTELVMRTPQSHTALENPPSRARWKICACPCRPSSQQHGPASCSSTSTWTTSPSSSLASSTTSWPASSTSSTSAQTFVDHRAHAHGHPDPHGPAVHDAARPGQPHHEPRRGIALHPRLGIQRGRGVLDLPTSTASPSDSRCCSWPSSCAPPGPGPAAPSGIETWDSDGVVPVGARMTARPLATTSLQCSRGHGSVHRTGSRGQPRDKRGDPTRPRGLNSLLLSHARVASRPSCGRRMDRRVCAR